MQPNRNNRQQALTRAWNVQEGYKPSVERTSHTYLPNGERVEEGANGRSEDLLKRLARTVADLQVYASAHDINWASVVALSQDNVNHDWMDDDHPERQHGYASYADFTRWVKND